MNDYEKSKALPTIKQLGHLPSKMRECIINAKRDTSDFREKLGQDVVEAICANLNIPTVRLYVHDRPQLHHDNSNGRLKNKTLGRYWHAGSCGHKIEIWNLTAKRHQRISNKVFFSVLCHEICHHVDCVFLGITTSPHTSGFYQRIAYIESAFS